MKNLKPSTKKKKHKKGACDFTPEGTCKVCGNELKIPKGLVQLRIIKK